MSFTFKKFKVNQELAAMKVGLDAVLLGAWANGAKTTNILDVGCGTGLLSLMMAQRFAEAQIHAIDIEDGALKQSAINFANSDFAERIRLTNISVQQLAKNSMQKYDAIVCNPPYFSKSLKAQNHARNTARHDDSLSLHALIEACASLLNSEGILSLVLPIDKENELLKYAGLSGLFINRKMLVRHTFNKPVKRGYWQLSKREFATDTMCLNVKEGADYSKAFKEITMDFYLKF